MSNPHRLFFIDGVKCVVNFVSFKSRSLFDKSTKLDYKEVK